MSSENDIVHLDEMIDAGQRLARHVEAITAASIVDDAVVYDAICMCLIRIGEGARLLSPELKSSAPDVPWLDVVNLRHRIAHGYSQLRTDVIWTTATQSAPPLLIRLGDLRRRVQR